jgi:hypothetical protein
LQTVYKRCNRKKRKKTILLTNLNQVWTVWYKCTCLLDLDIICMLFTTLWILTRQFLSLNITMTLFHCIRQCMLWLLFCIWKRSENWSNESANVLLLCCLLFFILICKNRTLRNSTVDIRIYIYIYIYIYRERERERERESFMFEKSFILNTFQEGTRGRSSHDIPY